MEKSLKRIEKLLHTTSSTLAQMKFSLMFDDINSEKNVNLGKRAEDLGSTLLEKFLEADDLNRRQNEFKLEASEILTKMDKMLAPNEFSRKNVNPLGRIKEINKNMSHFKLEQSKRGATKQSRQKLLSLINEEKFTPGMTSIKESVGCKQTNLFNEQKELTDKIHPISRKSESVLVGTKSPMIPKAELKNRILETQEVVDKGFQTARQLAQKVDSIKKGGKKDKTPSSGKTVSEINSKSLEERTESNESIKTIKCRRCFERKKSRKGEQVKTRVIDIKRNEFERGARSNLQLQHLPSLHIKGGLKVQKVHSLEIPASEEIVLEKTNTSISFLSHEQMEREKMEKVLEKLRKENCNCNGNENRTKYVECFNCGRLIKIRETWVNPQRIDEVLRKCNFNVFDPKIDEFVEKYRGTVATNRCEEIQQNGPIQSDAVVAAELEILTKNSEKVPLIKRMEKRKKKSFTLQDLSDQLCRKFKEEADTLAENHLKIDTILQNLFSQIEESKDVFETCRLLRNYSSDLEKKPRLTATKPVLVNLPRASLLVKCKQKKLDKKDVKNRRKSRTIFLDDNKFISQKETEEAGKGISSLVHSSWEKNFLQETKEVRESYFAPTIEESEITKQISKEEAEEMYPLASPSTYSSSNSFKPDSTFIEKKIKKTLMMASVQRKNTKELINKSLVGSSVSQSNAAEFSKTKKKEIEEMEESSIASSIFSRKGTCQPYARQQKKYFTTPETQLNSVKSILINENTEKKLLVISPNKRSEVEKGEKKSGPCQTSSEKSESNYESDFESFTNEQEGNGDDYDGEEQRRISVHEKLSTISEVNSELEKKFSDGQKTPSVERDKKVRCVNQKEGNPVACSISAKVKNNTETAEYSLKSTPKELVTSLRDIVTALQDQFNKTESLAEKMTGSSKVERKEKAELAPVANAILIPWKVTTPAKVIVNHQSLKIDWMSPKTNFERSASGRSKISEGISSANDTFEEGGSSLGEMILSEEKKNSSGVSNISSVVEESVLNLAIGDKYCD